MRSSFGNEINTERVEEKKGSANGYQLRKPRTQAHNRNRGNALESVYPEPDVNTWTQGTEKRPRENYE